MWNTRSHRTTLILTRCSNESGEWPWNDSLLKRIGAKRTRLVGVSQPAHDLHHSVRRDAEECHDLSNGVPISQVWDSSNYVSDLGCSGCLNLIIISEIADPARHTVLQAVAYDPVGDSSARSRRPPRLGVIPDCPRRRPLTS